MPLRGLRMSVWRPGMSIRGASMSLGGGIMYYNVLLGDNPTLVALLECAPLERAVALLTTYWSEFTLSSK